nr:tpr repeat-containing protein p27g11.02 [Quercus suber]
MLPRSTTQPHINEQHSKRFGPDVTSIIFHNTFSMSLRPALTMPIRHAAAQCSGASATALATRNLHTLQRARPRVSKAIQCLHQPQTRSKTSRSFLAGSRQLFRQNPVTATLAALMILGGIGSLVYANILYQNYIIAAFHNYPEPVAKKLRRALYYTNTDLQPQEAIKYYKQALQLAEEMGMDPFSDEIMGVKIQVAALCERCMQIPKAIEVLEILKRDTLEWIARFGGQDHNKQKRTKVLGKCVAISVKLGELNAHPAVYDREQAESNLTWAVETTLKERSRRQAVGATDESDGPWISDEESAATLEALAHNYEEKDQHYLSTPLFLQALNMQGKKDCHTVILMNNLASSLAQQSPRAAAAAQQKIASVTIQQSSATATPTLSRESLIENAKTWAEKALAVAAHVSPPDRSEECDVGCAVATHNLGEFAEMLGDTARAKERYVEAISLARAIGFREGVENSSARLQKLGGVI